MFAIALTGCEERDKTENTVQIDSFPLVCEGYDTGVEIHYGLQLLENEKNFEDIQVTFTGLVERNEEKVLCGSSSAIYRISGNRYSIEWEIDTDTLSESVKANSTDVDIPENQMN